MVERPVSERLTKVVKFSATVWTHHALYIWTLYLIQFHDP